MNRQQQLINQRAIAMAYVYLGERKDLEVREATDAQGQFDLFHYIVRLRFKSRKRGLRQFAVESLGELEVPSQAVANKLLAEKVQVSAHIGPYPYPTLVFLFSMRDDAGWYTWVSEPRLTDAGGAELVLRKKPDCHPLDRAALDGIVNRVDEWYDHFYAPHESAVAE